MPSIIRLLRTIFGIVLILVNTVLSLTSFLAVYSAVYFVSDPQNFRPNYTVDNGLNSSTPYLYVGTITVNNTGLFAFRNFYVEFELSCSEGTIMEYSKRFDDIESKEVAIVELNFTAPDANFSETIDFFTIDWANISGYMLVTGKYAFALFDFNLNLSGDAFSTIIGGT